MRVAAIYDIHGNLPALEAVTEEIRSHQVDLVVVGGDVVLGPMPKETLDFVVSLDIPTKFILGNTDREVLAKRDGIETDWFLNSPADRQNSISWTAAQLSDEHARLIHDWPKDFRLELPEIGNILFCHATPENDVDIFTRATPESVLEPVFEMVNEDVVVCGHTHMQFDRTICGKRVLNAGSVGMPFGKPGAYWLMIGTDIELRKTEYDLAAAAERIRQSNHPQAEHFAANNVLHPPSETEMVELFSKVELATNR